MNFAQRESMDLISTCEVETSSNKLRPRDKLISLFSQEAFYHLNSPKKLEMLASLATSLGCAGRAGGYHEDMKME